jgi:Sec-independent protein translocase protein TatA
MNIFGVGGAELVLIILIMLVIAGPKRMVHWAYYIGQWVGKFRKMWSEVVDVIQKEMDDAGVDVKIPKDLPTRQNLGKYVSELSKPYTKELQQAMKDVEKPVKETIDEAEKVVKETSTKTPVVKFTNPKKNAPTETSYGSWTQHVNNQTPKTDSPPSDNGYGAWSNPKSPGQQTEHEA